MNKLRSVFLIVLAFVFLFSSAVSSAYAPKVGAAEPASAAAASGKCGDDAYWSYTADGVLTISGKGATYNYSPDDTPWVVADCRPIRKIVVEEGITDIGQSAFAGLSAVRDVSLPSSLTQIGGCVFSGDSGLEFISIPENVGWIGDNAFSGCTSLKNIEFKGDKACFFEKTFYYCTSLESITLPGGMRSIGFEAFKFCKNLKTVYLSSITYVSPGAFAYCNSITDVYYPGSRGSWDEIKKISYFTEYSNDSIWNANIHYYHKYNYLPHCNIKLKYNVYAYTGKQVKPSVEVYTAAGTKLTKGKHFTVKYFNNVDCGIATVEVTGIGKYYGKKTYAFRINYRKVEDLKIVSSTDTTATISWKPSSGAVKYKVVYRTDSSYTTDCRFTVTGIDPNVQRKIWVYPIHLETDPQTGEEIEIKGTGNYVLTNAN